MTATTKKSPKRVKSTKRTQKPSPGGIDLKPFSVVCGKYLFWFTPEELGFSVVCQNLAGVNAQGDTFEKALANAVSMAEFVEMCSGQDGFPGR